MNMSIEVLQTQVQQKLGRCMILLQEYERQLKAMLVSMSVEGQPAALQAARSGLASSIHGKSLGVLVGLFTSDHLVSEAQERQAHENQSSGRNESPDSPFVTLKLRIVLSSEHHSRIKDGLAGLIRMRNDLVHHLLERFDLSGTDGCAEACAHLESCHQEVARQLSALRGWAEGTTQLAGLVSSVLGERTFEEMFRQGTDNTCSGRPDMDGVVETLKAAEAECCQDGWTLLDAAVRHVERMDQSETPRKYGCRSWRQVLARSERFEIRFERSGDGGRGRTLYRSSAKME
jgi:hypothetical protein